jgi:hypothetical protein
MNNETELPNGGSSKGTSLQCKCTLIFHLCDVLFTQVVDANYELFLLLSVQLSGFPIVNQPRVKTGSLSRCEVGLNGMYIVRRNSEVAELTKYRVRTPVEKFTFLIATKL